MAKKQDLATSVRKATIAAVPAKIRVTVQPRQSEAVPTFLVQIHAGSGQHQFLAGWAGEGWPADVKRLAAAAPDVDVVFAKQFSIGARDWLSAHQRGWVDESGNANVSLSTGLIIFREVPIRQVKQQAAFQWTPTMLAAAEATLSGVTPTVEAVQAATGISRGASTNALARLEKLDLLARSRGSRGPRSARRVVDIESFIDEYAKAAATLREKQRVIRIHRLWKDSLEELESAIAPALERNAESWAVTGGAASFLLAPYLSDVTVIELYVDDDLFANHDWLAETLGGTIVDRGHRIEVRALPTPMSANGPEMRGIRVALPARVYADLAAVGGRSAEAAHHLRETIDVGPRS
jgi:DNA-binding MarR family transcriptional regulator